MTVYQTIFEGWFRKITNNKILIEILFVDFCNFVEYERKGSIKDGIETVAHSHLRRHLRDGDAAVG